MKIDYTRYETLNIQRRGPGDAVLDIQMKAANGKLPTAGHAGHRELTEIWRDVGADDSVRCAVLRGEGLGFSGGGLALVQDMANDFDTRSRVWEARTLVYNVINCDKPIVSAIHGPAVGAGLVAGLLADISVAARGEDRGRPHPAGRGRRRPRGHRLAGQGQVLPDAVRAGEREEAERIGLVSLMDGDQLLPRAYEIADRLAQAARARSAGPSTR